MPAKDIRDDREPLDDTEDMGEEQQTPLNPLLLQIDEDTQKELVAVAIEDYRNAMEARQETSWATDKAGKGIDFDTKYADLVALYEGEDEERPESWMCGRSLKLAQGIVEMLIARLFPAIWNEDMIRWRPVEYTDKKRTDDVNKIMGWVLRVWMKFRKDALDITRTCVSMGTVFVKPYWYVKKRDLGNMDMQPQIDPATGMQAMDESGAHIYIEKKLLHTEEKPAVKIISLTNLLTQPGATDIQKEPIIELDNYYYYELEQEQREGIAQNVTDQLKDSIDKTIFSKFGAELEKAEKIRDLNAKRRNSMVECFNWYGSYDVNGDGFPEEICIRVALKEEIYLQGYEIAKISRRGIRPIEQINFLNRMFRLLGIGVLEQVKPLAEEIDACFRQLQDANTLGIMKWGFYDPNSDYDPAEHVAKPRSMYPVTNPQQNVYFPDMNVPIERLINAIRLLMEFVERLTAASSYIMGKESDIVGGSGTATRTQAIVSSADARFNIPAMNIREGLGNVITQLFDLCFLNMPDGLEKRILGENHEPIFETNDAIKEAFATQMDSYIEPNSAFGDVNTMRELATILYDKFVLGGNPLVVGSIERLYHASANVFKAYGEEPKEWIGPAPVSKETNDPYEEHTIIREGRVISPDPQENHLEHIMVHANMLQNPELITWPPDAVQVLQQHIEEHKNMMMQIMQFQQQGKKGVSGEAGGQAGGGRPTEGKPGVPGNANPAESAARSQTQGTTLGTAAM